MASNNEIHIVFLQPSRDNIGAKREADTSVIFRPSGNIFIWVAPKQVTEKTTVRYLGSIMSQQAGQRERWMELVVALSHICWPHDAANLFHRVQIRTKSPMAAKYLLVHDSGNRHTVEHVDKGLP